MKVLAAYLLATLGGNNEPSAEDLKNILASVGIEAEDDRLDVLLSQVKGKDLAEVVASGREKMASVVSASAAPSGGAASAGVAGAPAAAEPTKEEEEAEEKKEDSDEESSIYDLFA